MGTYHEEAGKHVARIKNRSPLQRNADDKARMLARVKRASDDIASVMYYCSLTEQKVAKQWLESIADLKEQVKAEYQNRKKILQDPNHIPF